MARYQKGQSGNPGGRPKAAADVQQLARQYAPEAINELARLAKKAKSERARVAAIRELLDRAYGRPRQALDVGPAIADPLQALLDEIDAGPRLRVTGRTDHHVNGAGVEVEPTDVG